MAFQKGNTYSKGQIPWNKGKKGLQVAWNKGLTGVQVPWNKGVTGYKLKPCSEEQKEFLRNFHKGNKYNLGKHNSNETKEKKRIAMTGKKWTDDQKQKLKGRIRPESHCRNISLAKIATRDSYSGENSVHWKGGISFEPYCTKFNNNFKEAIRNKYDRLCFICSKNENENGQRLSIHHVNYDKNCLCDDIICEFVPLCVSCHSKTNHNRDYYEELIMNKITKVKSNVN